MNTTTQIIATDPSAPSPFPETITPEALNLSDQEVKDLRDIVPALRMVRRLTGNGDVRVSISPKSLEISSSICQAPQEGQTGQPSFTLEPRQVLSPEKTQALRAIVEKCLSHPLFPIAAVTPEKLNAQTIKDFMGDLCDAINDMDVVLN